MKNKNKNCIIFGGGGFIGSNLAEELVEKGYKVTVFDKLYFNRFNLKSFINNIDIIEGDFFNKQDIKKALRNKDIVIHLVSSTVPENSNQNPIYDIETNLISSINLFNECIANNISKIIFISSGGTVYGIPKKIPIKEDYYGHPLCSYGIVKKTIEDYLFMFNRLYGLDFYIFRLSNPFGIRQNPKVSQGVIPVFLYKTIKKEKIEVWGDGTVVRDFIYIKDAVNCIVKSLNVNTSEKIFNLGSGKGYSLNEILKVIHDVTNIKPNVIYLPARSIDVPINILDSSLARKTFKWEPKTSLKEGINNLYKYFLKNIKFYD
ncbi:MAG: NAD-dependent epimerase/dehydratase family protein [Ignavibacteria bacterium]|nr:NAD-dependent epimerase/dehydratase family protein [Ignavibacteria bacterium]